MTAAADVIDLCSDDSEQECEPIERPANVTEIRKEKHTTESRRVWQGLALSDLDIELDLDELLPHRAAKRRRMDRFPLDGGKSTTAGGASDGHIRPPLLLDQLLGHDVTDPISSSQPCDTGAARSMADQELGAEPLASANTTRRESFGLSQSTATLLAEISTNTSRKSRGSNPSKLASMVDDIDSDDAHVPSTTFSKEQLASIRKAAQLARKAEKEDAKAAAVDKKRLERERKAMEKELAANHAEANKGRHDKKISTPEMVVDVHTSLLDGHMYTDLQKLLKELSVDLGTHNSRAANVIKWRRKSKTIFNAELKHWELRPEVILDEPQVCCIYTAKQFVENTESRQLHASIEAIRGEFPDCKVLLLIEGLESFLKKQRNQKNRAYLAAARQESNGTASRATQPSASIEEDAIEDVLVELPITHDISIFHTINALETAEWISDLTQHISTVPYKKERSNLDSQFCMDTGQVKAGEDARDVYVRALQQVVRVTAPIAYGIAAEHGDVPSLIRAFRTHGDLALEDIQKHVNRDGTVSNARVGPQISRRLAKVFTSLDPDSMDI